MQCLPIFEQADCDDDYASGYDTDDHAADDEGRRLTCTAAKDGHNHDIDDNHDDDKEEYHDDNSDDGDCDGDEEILSLPLPSLSFRSTFAPAASLYLHHHRLHRVHSHDVHDVLHVHHVQHDHYDFHVYHDQDNHDDHDQDNHGEDS